ncbi:MAG: c-type cytochrome [Caldilineaceae bacterium]|nr:c-type cytochrome [Caldilineaceae bacterium]
MSRLIQARIAPIAGLFFALTLLAGCALTMRDQPRDDPFEPSAFFADGASARVPVADTVARGQLQTDTLFATGRIGRDFAETFPFTITLETLERGHERYDIFCSPCHGLVGEGNGLVTEYGMPNPPSFHDPDLRDEPSGYYFALITGGTRVMPSYASRIPPADRWAIVAYIRALQLSQSADLSQVPADQLPLLQQTDTITK